MGGGYCNLSIRPFWGGQGRGKRGRGLGRREGRGGGGLGRREEGKEGLTQKLY